jgi:hypothetical protein
MIDIIYIGNTNLSLTKNTKYSIYNKCELDTGEDWAKVSIFSNDKIIGYAHTDDIKLLEDIK